ncbi:phage minor head protein [Methylomagnum ishizawai]|uniref:phage head morphogenesis protein n=1 Tax=Methylomagnum ishizawai TaxID=1760988 RepID=UPI001C326D42|nr:phage minor head protein [Methylomagnum ishizawai]BBL73664.1 hypothetical protein MishRS11D_07620 [Methylomagnum ishizawai]
MPVKLDLLPAEEAIKALEAKGYKLSFDHRDVLAEEHTKNVTVAKMLRVDLLQTVQDALVQTEKQGWDLRRFSQELRPTLEKAGWWGRQEMTDPLTGEVKTVQLGSPARLQIIYDTNLRTSYSAGRWMRGERSAQALPILLYRTMRDTRVRPLHAAWDGTALPRSDAWWDTHYPPNGWRCRCIAYPISEADVQTLKDSGRVEIKTTAPPTRTVEWTNPRTGEVRQVPLGIDPGFDYNPGKAAQAHLDGLLREKEAALAKSIAAPVQPAPRRATLDSLSVVQQERLSVDFLDTMRQAVAGLPKPVRTPLAAEGYEIVVAPELTRALPGLAGIRPRGYPEGYAWENSSGVTMGKTIAVAEHYTEFGSGRRVAEPVPAGVLRHEVGHAFDMARGLSRHPDVVAAYAKDASALRAALPSIADPDAVDDLEYALQPGDAGIEEAVAEVLADLSGGGSFQYIYPAKAFPALAGLLKPLLEEN